MNAGVIGEAFGFGFFFCFVFFFLLFCMWLVKLSLVKKCFYCTNGDIEFVKVIV